MSNLELYHGSNLEVKNPKILPNLRALDFGAGFYLTSNKKQASTWAKSVARRRGKGIATVSVYTVDYGKLTQLKILKFQIPDGDWLDFVVANRKELFAGESYDLVIGPVANDYTLPVIDDYMDGKYKKEEAIERLLPQKLTDQFAFLTSESLKLLTFKESEKL